MYTGPVIDCDIHHDWPSADALLPYFSDGWRDYITRSGTMRMISPAPTALIPNPGGIIREEAYPPDGTMPGSSYELLRDQLLDPSRIAAGVLSFGLGAFVGAIPNPYLATEIARVANDWSIDNWLSGQDDRLYGAVLVPTQLPEDGAKEIRRIGDHPRIIQALMVSNGIGKPFGHPLFHPIYEAAAEMDLPIGIHVGGEAFGGQNISPIGSGVPSLYLEHHTLVPQGIMAHLVSFIVHGVFEKFPTLKLLLIECGVAWIPGVIWRFDMDYKGLRRETPWLKRHPSEYFHDHVRVTTQPLELAPKKEHLVNLLRGIGGEDVLCFSSDYPHWDTDEADYVAQQLPREWLPKIMFENAAELFGLQHVRDRGAARAGVGA
jgi:predicted TIM-barrel fold metal-dependent hydrolase